MQRRSRAKHRQLPARRRQVGRDLRVAVAGLGAIGRVVAERLDRGIAGLRLVAVSARNVERARGIVAGFARPVRVLPLARLAGVAEVVVECLPAGAFLELAATVVDAGGILVAASVGQLLANPALIERAARTGARIVVPTGALIGLDAVRAAAEGSIASVRMITRKPPRGLEGAPHLVAQGITLAGLAGPLKVFEGSARDAVRGFPANVNVAAALSLAGIGADRTTIEVWADPAVERNTHSITVDADSARFTMTIENMPSADNPRTGAITGLSVIAVLRRLRSPLQIGT